MWYTEFCLLTWLILSDSQRLCHKPQHASVSDIDLATWACDGVMSLYRNGGPPSQQMRAATAGETSNASDGEHYRADISLSNCAVCIEEWKSGDTLRTLPCFHIFHMDCIDEWIRRQGSCPICRTNFSADAISRVTASAVRALTFASSELQRGGGGGGSQCADGM